MSQQPPEESIRRFWPPSRPSDLPSSRIEEADVFRGACGLCEVVRTKFEGYFGLMSLGELLREYRVEKTANPHKFQC